VKVGKNAQIINKNRNEIDNRIKQRENWSFTRGTGKDDSFLSHVAVPIVKYRRFEENCCFGLQEKALQELTL
jgi:hypothetical protein